MNEIEIQKYLFDLLSTTTVSLIPELIKIKLKTYKKFKFAFIEPSIQFINTGVCLTLKNIGYEKAFDICYLIKPWDNKNFSNFTLDINEQISFDIDLCDFDSDTATIAITWLDSKKRKNECYYINILKNPIEINIMENKNELENFKFE